MIAIRLRRALLIIRPAGGRVGHRILVEQGLVDRRRLLRGPNGLRRRLQNARREALERVPTGEERAAAGEDAQQQYTADNPEDQAGAAAPLRLWRLLVGVRIPTAWRRSAVARLGRRLLTIPRLGILRLTVARL